MVLPVRCLFLASLALLLACGGTRDPAPTAADGQAHWVIGRLQRDVLVRPVRIEVTVVDPLTSPWRTQASSRFGAAEQQVRFDGEPVAYDRDGRSGLLLLQIARPGNGMHITNLGPPINRGAEIARIRAGRQP